jgi:hypothetical protein
MQMNNVGCIIFDRKISSNTGSKNPAMIFPRDSEIYSLYPDTNGTTFVQTPGENRVFFLREEWTHIKDVIKNDSMVLAIVYRNKSEELVMGIYDILKASGVSYKSRNIFARQQYLFSIFAQNNKTNLRPSITPHWVGEEGSLQEHMNRSEFLNTLPFEIDHILRINECINKETSELSLTEPATYNLVLRPLLIPEPLINFSRNFSQIPELPKAPELSRIHRVQESPEESLV